MIHLLSGPDVVSFCLRLAALSSYIFACLDAARLWENDRVDNRVVFVLGFVSLINSLTSGKNQELEEVRRAQGKAARKG